QAGAAAALLRQLAREDLPDIRRATLLAELAGYPSAAAQRAVNDALGDASPLVRRSAVDTLPALLPPAHQAPLLQALLEDPVRAVRLAAAWQLLQLEAPQDMQARRRMIVEYEQAQHSLLERAEAHYNLAGVYVLTGRDADVEPALREALRRDDAFHPATIMLAQWQEQVRGDPAAAQRTLREALARHPSEASLHHARGLMLVRQGLHAQALPACRRASELAPQDGAYAYVLAAALHGRGETQQALDVLREQLRRQPANRAVRSALISYLRAAGELGEAQTLLAELAAQNPGDPLLRANTK